MERFADDDIIFQLMARNETFPVISSGLDGTREAAQIVHLLLDLTTKDEKVNEGIALIV